MKKTMNTVQAGREMQERSFKRMMAYQKKAEQAVNKKRMERLVLHLHHIVRVQNFDKLLLANKLSML